MDKFIEDSSLRAISPISCVLRGCSCRGAKKGYFIKQHKMRGPWNPQYLGAVFNPLKYYGKVWSVFRLVLPALGHYSVPETEARNQMVNARKGHNRWIKLGTVTHSENQKVTVPMVKQSFHFPHFQNNN